MQVGRVLVVDDDEDLLALLEVGLTAHDFEVEGCPSAEAALARIDAGWDAILTDLSMPGMDGLAFCRRVLDDHPEQPVLVMTAYGKLETAVEALRAGAWDYILKPLDVNALAHRLVRVVEGRKLRAEVERLNAAVEASRSFSAMIGASAPMKQIYDLLERVGASEAFVLVTGESGTGKELVARALHESSRRCEGPFVTVNCAAVPHALMESELFGHAKGAFTDARSDRQGLFEAASGGTLFLDEIGEMPLSVQPKLLRVLEERAVRPVGSNAEQAIDVRVIVATNRDLETAIEEGKFREDLYFRVNVVHVELPPLRARGNDVLLLANHFLTRFSAAARREITGLSSAAAERLMGYNWPGNVRELRNCLERAVALARYSEITVDDLPPRVRDFNRSHVLVAAQDPTELLPMEEVECRYIERVMEAVGGNKTMAARVLGFDRKTLYRKLARMENNSS